MPKRKVTSESDKTKAKKLKGDKGSEKKSTTKLSFDSAEQAFTSLIYPTTLDMFFDKHWEKGPLLIARKDAGYYGEMPTKARLEEIVKQESLEYNDGIFLSPPAKTDKGLNVLDVEGPVTVENLHKYFNEEKAIVTFERIHQFHDELFRLLQLLESYFGSCAVCLLEVTPSREAPLVAYTGRETFFLQVEGKEHWCLYKPVLEVANMQSDGGYLDKNDIGVVTHEYELEAGDLLYFPHGTAFQAASSSDQHSSHIRIDLYEDNSWGNFLSTIANKAIKDAMANDVSFREGLPLNFLSYMGFAKKEFSSESCVQRSDLAESSGKGNMAVPSVSMSVLEKQKAFQEKLKKLLSSLSQYLDPHWGADEHGKLFIGNRLPPFKNSDATQDAESESNDSDAAPNEDSAVQMKFPDYVRITHYDPLEDEADGDGEEEDESEAEEEEEGEEKENTKKNEVGKAKSRTATDKALKKNDNSEKKSSKTSVKAMKNGNGETEKDQGDKEEKDSAMEEDNSLELDDSFCGKQCIVLQHSLHNELESSETLKEPDTLKFPLHYRDALLILHRSTKPVAVKDLPLVNDERVELVVTLWSEGLLKIHDS